MKRSRIRRRAKTKHQLANAEHKEYIAWIHQQPCCACGHRGEAIQAAHVGRGGMGMKHGSDAEVIPLCGPRWIFDHVAAGCHADHDQFTGKFIPRPHQGRSQLRAWRQEWDAHQVAVHRGRFEARTTTPESEMPF